jgi:hypothetical protein
MLEGAWAAVVRASGRVETAELAFSAGAGFASGFGSAIEFEIQEKDVKREIDNF